MNYFLFPTLLIAAILFAVGVIFSRRSSQTLFILICTIGFAIALPGMLFALHYTKLLGDPLWLYEFRSVRGSELSAGGAGLLAGLLHGRFAAYDRFRKTAGRWFFPVLLLIGLVVPYLKI